MMSIIRLIHRCELHVNTSRDVAVRCLNEETNNLLRVLQMFQKCLVQMFAARKQDVIFMETVYNPSKNQHTVSINETGCIYLY